MKNIWRIDLIIILVSVFVLLGIIGYIGPLVVAPLDVEEILFSFGNVSSFLIDDNEDFSSPDEYFFEDGLKLDLGKGVYYLKVDKEQVSEVNRLEVKSELELEFIRTEKGWDVVNVGGFRLNVEVYNKSELIKNKLVEIRG